MITDSLQVDGVTEAEVATLVGGARTNQSSTPNGYHRVKLKQSLNLLAILCGVTVAFVATPHYAQASVLAQHTVLPKPAGVTNVCETQPSYFSANTYVPRACCSGYLGIPQLLWNPPWDPYHKDPDHGGCAGAEYPNEQWFYNAYGFAATAGKVWRFSTCGYGPYSPSTAQRQCQSVFNFSPYQDGFAARLLVYKAPFIPGLPCRNLIADCDNEGLCNNIAATIPSNGQYVLVVTSVSSLQRATRRQTANNPGGPPIARNPIDRATGPFKVLVDTSDPAFSTTFCQTSPQTQQAIVHECIEDLGPWDNAMSGLPLIKWGGQQILRGSPSGCSRSGNSVRSNRYDAYPFSVTSRTAWRFGTCSSGTLSVDLMLILYRGMFDPGMTCDDENGADLIIAQSRQTGKCNDLDEGQISVTLDPGQYTVVVAERIGEYCPAVKKPIIDYRLRVYHEPSQTFACSPVTIAPAGSACGNTSQTPTLPCSAGQQISYQGRLFYCVLVRTTVCGVPGQKRGLPALQIDYTRALDGKLHYNRADPDSIRWTACNKCGSYCLQDFCGTASLQNAAVQYKLQTMDPFWTPVGGELHLLPTDQYPGEVRLFADFSHPELGPRQRWLIERYGQWTLPAAGKGKGLNSFVGREMYAWVAYDSTAIHASDCSVPATCSQDPTPKCTE